jgi:16S rRNA (cytosine967-C5)-methyltransferase
MPAAKTAGPKRRPTHSPRIASHRAVCDVICHHRNLDDALGHLTNLTGQDRSFARMLVMTSLRHGVQIQHVLSNHFLEDPDGLPDSVIITLILGMTQLFFMQTSAHAAIDESVNLQKSVGPRKLSGLVNGVLRNAQRTGKDKLFDNPTLALPDWLTGIIPADNQDKFAKAILTPPPIDLSPLNPENESLRQELSAIRLANGSWRVDATQLSGSITSWPGFEQGKWWVQDAGARLPLLTADGNLNGKSVLDIGAAPGGKTMQAIAAGANVTALDPSAERMETLADNLSRLAMSADIAVNDLQSYRPDKRFDIVMLDAPCSAIGTLRRHPDMIYHKSANNLEKHTWLQAELLDRALAHVKPGGQLIYAVCSFYNREGTGQFDQFLKRHSDRVERRPITVSDLTPCPDGAGGDQFSDLITKDGNLLSMPYHLSDLGGIDGFFTGRCHTK